MCGIGIPKDEERKKGTEEICKTIRQNFPKLNKNKKHPREEERWQ